MRALWLNSGGPDSLVAAALFLQDNPEAVLVSCYVNHNPHARDRVLAGVKRNADLIGAVDRVVLPMPASDRYWWVNPRGFFMHRLQTLFLFVHGALEAMANNCQVVVTGYKTDINSGPDYVRRIQEVINMSTMTTPNREDFPVFVLPLKDERTSDLSGVVGIAERLGLDLSHTWSCNRYPACRTCMKCKERERLRLTME